MKLLQDDEPGMPPAAEDPQKAEDRRREVLHTLQDLVDCCNLLGLVPTVEQVPLQPLAMGHYKTVVSVRWSRELEPWMTAGAVAGSVQ